VFDGGSEPVRIARPGENSVHYLRIDEPTAITTLCNRDLKKRGLKVTIAVNRVSCLMCVRHLETDAKPCSECDLLHPPAGARRRSPRKHGTAYVAKLHWFTTCARGGQKTKDKAAVTCGNCLRALKYEAHWPGSVTFDPERKRVDHPSKLHLRLNPEWLVCGKRVDSLVKAIATDNPKDVTCGACVNYVERGMRRVGPYAESKAKVHYRPAGAGDEAPCKNRALRSTSDAELVTCLMCRNFLMFGKMLPFMPSPWRKVPS
jgi:hypothetical protein